MVLKGSPEECWPWRGRPKPEGYGQLRYCGRTQNAHRVAYRLHHGSIPEGLTIDHLCRNRLCCNPAHLEAVTMGENVRRGRAPPARNHRKTHCKRGHPLRGKNLYVNPRGSRICRKCQLMHGRSRAHLRRKPRAPVTHCKNGHPYSGDNLHVIATTGVRVCKACRAERARQYKARNRERVLAAGRAYHHRTKRLRSG